MSPMNPLTHRQRIEACLSGDKPDRVPVALWRHFPVDDQSPDGLAAAILAFQNTFDFDLVKVTPSSSYCLHDWGVQDEWHGSTEGTRDYTVHVIDQPDDWTRLAELDPHAGFLGESLTCLRLLVAELNPHTPVIQTIFSPLAQAKNLLGKDELLVHMRRYPDALHRGLKTIAATSRAYIAAARQTGIDGVFYAIQHAQYSLLSEEEYLEFGKPYDLQVLEGTAGLWLNMLHLHGADVMFNLAADYPVQVLNWHDRETPPSLAEGLSLFPGAVCGGLSREEGLVLSSPVRILGEAKDAILETGGKRFILGTGCVVPITAPAGNLHTARRSVDLKP